MNLTAALFKKNEPNFDQVAIYYYENFAVKKHLTFGELFSAIETKSKLLRQQKAEGFVLLCLTNPVEFIISFLALISAGCVPVPLPPADLSRSEDFTMRLNNLFLKYQFDFVVTDEISRANFLDYRIPVLDSTLVYDQGVLLRKTQPAHHNACFIQFSSGSTSEPKGIVINHEQLLNNLQQINEALRPTVTDKIISWLPLHHDMGLVGAILSALYAKTEIHLMSTRDYIGNADRFLDLVCGKKINFMLGPDFMYRQLSKVLENKNYDLSHLKVCLSGAELVLPSTARQFQAALLKSKCQTKVFMPVYGMAEVCLGVTFTRLSDSKNQSINIFKTPAGREVVSCGYPLKGLTVKILDSQNNQQPDGQVGEVAVSGSAVFTEYYMNLDIKNTVTGDFYLTGDDGFISEGELYLLGRKKDIVIHHGIKHHSLDLENLIYEKLKKHIGRIACVQANSVYVVAEISWHSFYKIFWIKHRIANILSQKISIDKKNILVVPKYDLPRTTSGKVQRFKVIEKIENKGYQKSCYFLRSVMNSILDRAGHRS